MIMEKFRNSGILEAYCLGFTNDAQNLLVEAMANVYPEVKAELEKMRLSLSHNIKENTMEPTAVVKKRLMESLKAGQK
ncbi:MAG: hypothetical protein ABIY51_00080 [Ferruginibacter sp.]